MGGVSQLLEGHIPPVVLELGRTGGGGGGGTGSSGSSSKRSYRLTAYTYARTHTLTN